MMEGQVGRGLRALAAAVLLASSLVAGCSKPNDTAKLLNPDPPAKMYADADGLMRHETEREIVARARPGIDRHWPLPAGAGA